MKRLYRLLLFLTLPVLIVTGFSNMPDFNPFFNPPGESALVFGAGEVSNGFGNRDMAISPAGDEIFFTMQQGENLSAILHAQKKGAVWTSPQVASFSGKFSDLEPAFSPDGKRLYFVSRRPVKEEEKKDYDIWFVTRKDNGWSMPERLPAPVNSNENEFYPSITRTGDIYFTLDVGAAKEDIVVCRKKSEGTYAAPVSLPAGINTDGYEFNAFVDPDEEMILFTGHNRPGGFGNGDIFISRKGIKNDWMPAVNAGAAINSSKLDYCPFISPDKKYLFFTSNRSAIRQPFKQSMEINELKSMLQLAGNGLDDIYWISLSAIRDSMAAK